MGYEIEHKGMLVECHVSGGEPMTRDYPGCPPEVEQESVCVSDWDELAEYWGAKGEHPMFAVSLSELLERASEREWDYIADAALDAAHNDEPDFDPPDDYDFDDFG